MRTLESRSPESGWRRDLALLRRMAGMLWVYATIGARVRGEYRRCQARGETLWLDGGPPTRHREDAGRR